MAAPRYQPEENEVPPRFPKNLGPIPPPRPYRGRAGGQTGGVPPRFAKTFSSRTGRRSQDDGQPLAASRRRGRRIIRRRHRQDRRWQVFQIEDFLIDFVRLIDGANPEANAALRLAMPAYIAENLPLDVGLKDVRPVLRLAAAAADPAAIADLLPCSTQVTLTAAGDHLPARPPEATGIRSQR